MDPGRGDSSELLATGPWSADVEMDTECCSGGEAAAAHGAGLPMTHMGGDHPQPLWQPLVDGQGSKNWGLLSLARQLVHEGKPSLALQAVVTAVKTEGGEHAVLQVLHRARELYRSKLQEAAAAGELAFLFAQCAITEADPFGAEPPPVPAAGNAGMLPAMEENSILAESGRVQIVLDAFSDGSSFICLQCGGLVSSRRKLAHLSYWCPGQL